MSLPLSARPARCLARTLLLACVPLVASSGALAQEMYGLQPPLATSLPRALQDGWSANVQREPDQGSQATLWRSLGRMSIGLGLQRRPPGELHLGDAPERDGSELLVGVALRTGRQSRLTFQSSPAALLGAEPPGDAPPGTMVLKSSDPYRAVRRGVLRMELDNESAIGLRMRKRLVMLQYSKTW